MCSCCGAGVLRAAVKVIPEFVYSKASACACVKTERFQVRPIPHQKDKSRAHGFPD
jgi:hypothetical protein